MKEVFNVPMMILGFLFAVAVALTSVFKPDGGADFNFILLLIGLCIFAALVLVNSKLINNQSGGSALKINDKAFCIRCFLIYIVIGILTQIIYFPATLSNDTIVMIRGGMGVSGQHPWMYIALLRGLEKIVKFFGGADNEVFIILAVFQVVAVSFSYSVCVTWLKRKGLHKIPLLIICAFFALCPILNLYMVTLIKDVPFALGSLLIIPIMYELWESKGQKLCEKYFIAKLCACSILFFFRSNGSIICVMMVLYLMISYKSYWKKVAIYALFVALLLVMTKAVQTVSHAPYKFREAVGIPIQQIAATVCNDGRINEEQYAFIDKMLPVEEIKKNYDPYNVDPIKYGEIELDSEFLNANKLQFIKVWGELLLNNFGIYVDAYLRTTYGFWSFSNNTLKMRYTYIGAFADQKMYYDWMESERIVPKSVLSSDLQGFIENIYSSSSYFFGAGVMAWVILVLVAALMRIHGRKIGIVGLPAVLCWITLLASTPIAFQWRYALSFAYSLPMLYGIAMISAKIRK
ncbi:hypothetical protein SAMN02910276_02366 [Butyrivibrio sp. Su6]|uniref:DUF6020 family protein n=1 Tax=Butyrivibrio sp. Su6 TaxID=1520810 RepID=UPI00089F0F7F|nr:DUF6020 family protein [Butyrivibrio sp. Su6]SEG26514.1 hypothetical protein SAMN02910276_02366 [Butyrivibrio sp. Su6]